MKNLIVLTVMIVSTVSFAKPSSSKPFYDEELKLHLIGLDKMESQAFSNLQNKIITEHDIEVAKEYAKNQAKRKMMKEYIDSINKSLGDLASGPVLGSQAEEALKNLGRAQQDNSETHVPSTEASASESVGQ